MGVCIGVLCVLCVLWVGVCPVSLGVLCVFCVLCGSALLSYVYLDCWWIRILAAPSYLQWSASDSFTPIQMINKEMWSNGVRGQITHPTCTCTSKYIGIVCKVIIARKFSDSRVHSSDSKTYTHRHIQCKWTHLRNMEVWSTGIRLNHLHVHVHVSVNVASSYHM